MATTPAPPAPAVPRAAAWFGWALAAASLGLAALLAARVARLEEALRLGDPAVRRGRLEVEAPDAARLPWTRLADDSARALGGYVTWSDARDEGYLTFTGLTPNDPRVAQFQLWIFRGTDLEVEPYPIDGGVFDIPELGDAPAGGEVIVPIDAKLAVDRAGMFLVTLEAPGGVVVSARARTIALARRALD